MDSFAYWNNSFPFEPTFTMPTSGLHYSVPGFESSNAFSSQKTCSDESLPSSKRIRSGLSTYVPICQSTSMAKAQQQLPVLIPQQQQHIILDSSNPPACTNPLWSGTISIDNCFHSRLDLQVTGFNTSSNTQLFRFFESHPQANCNLWPSSLSVYAFCSTSRLHLFRKNALGILCLCPESASAHNYDMFLYHLTATGTIAVIELEENTLFLVPFRQERIYAVLLHKVVDVSHFFPRGLYSLSVKYHREGRLADRMMDGFYDPGRVGEILEISEYQNMKVDPMTREVLLVDSNMDAKLAANVKRAEELLNAFSDLESKARVLALFVSNVFGGDFPSTQSSSQEISALKILRNSNIIPIGEITRGVCRHRSILYKYLCDRVAIPCELRRGNYAGSTSTGAHSWNIIKLGMSHYVVDIMHEPTQLYTVDSQKAKNYMRVAHIDGEVQYVPENICFRNKVELSEKRFLKVPKVTNEVVMHEKLGRGGYGSVYRVTVGGLTCAMKKIDLVKLSEKQREYALQEVAVMEKFNHKNIVHYLGHESNSDVSEIKIFMELFPFSLGQLIDRRRKQNQSFSTSEISDIAIHILRGMDYLHTEMQILHRDLKSDNILVDLDETGKINKVKLTDFGVCKFIRKLPEDMTRVGTELFLAPEVHTMTQYSVASDVFAFGMILVELATLAPPFTGLTKSTAIMYIKNGKMPEIPQKEKKLISIVNSCLRVEPELRPSPKMLIMEFCK